MKAGTKCARTRVSLVLVAIMLASFAGLALADGSVVCSGSGCMVTTCDKSGKCNTQWCDVSGCRAVKPVSQ